MVRDNSSIEHTCPIIDKVITFIDNVDCEDISSNEISDVIRLMEEIRKANSGLRKWGNEQYERAEDVENERNILENKYNNAQDEIYDLNNEIDSLKSEIFDLKNELINV